MFLGSYIRICNLHISPLNLPQSSDNDQNSPQPVVSELYLHGGVIFDRGILPVDEDMADTAEIIR